MAAERSREKLIAEYWAAQAQFGPFDKTPNEHVKDVREADLLADIRRIAETGELPEWAEDFRHGARSAIVEFCHAAVKRMGE